jgi:hypothetical protein
MSFPLAEATAALKLMMRAKVSFGYLRIMEILSLWFCGLGVR